MPKQQPHPLFRRGWEAPLAFSLHEISAPGLSMLFQAHFKKKQCLFPQTSQEGEAKWARLQCGISHTHSPPKNFSKRKKNGTNRFSYSKPFYILPLHKQPHPVAERSVSPYVIL